MSEVSGAAGPDVPDEREVPMHNHRYIEDADGTERRVYGCPVCESSPEVAAAVSGCRRDQQERLEAIAAALLRGGQTPHIRCQDALRIIFPPDGTPPSDFALDRLRAALAGEVNPQ